MKKAFAHTTPDRDLFIYGKQYETNRKERIRQTMRDDIFRELNDLRLDLKDTTISEKTRQRIMADIKGLSALI